MCGYSRGFLGEVASNDSWVVEDFNYKRFRWLFVRKLKTGYLGYTPWAIKMVPVLFLRQLWQMGTDFNNSFTFGFVDKLRNKVK